MPLQIAKLNPPPSSESHVAVLSCAVSGTMLLTHGMCLVYSVRLAQHELLSEGLHKLHVKISTRLKGDLRKRKDSTR